MVMSASTLGSGLATMAPTGVEAEAIDNFASAFETYFYGASITGIPVVGGTLSGATNAMKAAMTGLSQDGPAAIQAGITAFWGVVATAYATIWITAPALILATQPPTLSGIAAELGTVFASNTSSKLELEAAANAVANAIHTKNLGGIATLGPPPPGGTPQPIL